MSMNIKYDKILGKLRESDAAASSRFLGSDRLVCDQTIDDTTKKLIDSLDGNEQTVLGAYALPIVIARSLPHDVALKSLTMNVATGGKVYLWALDEGFAFTTANTSGGSSAKTVLSDILQSLTLLGEYEVDGGIHTIDLGGVELPAGSRLVFGNPYADDNVLWNVTQGAGDLDYVYFYGSGAVGNKLAYADNIASAGIVVDYDYVAVTQQSRLREALRPKTAGKRFSVLGDSISTFVGTMPPGWLSFYPYNGNNVTELWQMWWKRAGDALGMELDTNNSWSGTTVAAVGSGAANAGVKDKRCKALGNPDVIFIFMGTNDWNNDVEMGAYDGHGTIPSGETTFRDAYAKMLGKVLDTYPQARVYCLTAVQGTYGGTVTFPKENGLGLTIDEYNDAIREIADAMSVEVIDTYKCGITFFNLGIYMGDDSYHPNSAGHALLADQVTGKIDAGVALR